MSALSKCQAAVPAKCRYHGVDSVAHTKVLHQKMLIAIETYKAVRHEPQAYNAYATMRDAQKEYFSTTQGLGEIDDALAKNDISDNLRTQLETIRHSALAERALHEEAIDANSPITYAIKPRKELPPSHLSGLEQPGDPINISLFKHNGETLSVNYDSARSIIYVTSKDTPEASEIIGRATNQEEALIKATEWYNRNFNR